MTQAQISDEIYKVTGYKCINVDTSINECQSLNIAMQKMLSELECADVNTHTRGILDNIGDLLSIQERTFEMLKKQNDDVENELRQIAYSLKEAENKTTA